MIHTKLPIRLLLRRGLESIVGSAACVQLLYKFIVRAPFDNALFVEDGKDTDALHVD